MIQTTRRMLKIMNEPLGINSAITRLEFVADYCEARMVQEEDVARREFIHGYKTGAEHALDILSEELGI